MALQLTSLPCHFSSSFRCKPHVCELGHTKRTTLRYASIPLLPNVPHGVDCYSVEVSPFDLWKGGCCFFRPVCNVGESREVGLRRKGMLSCARTSIQTSWAKGQSRQIKGDAMFSLCHCREYMSDVKPTIVRFNLCHLRCMVTEYIGPIHIYTPCATTTSFLRKSCHKHAVYVCILR